MTALAPILDWLEENSPQFTPPSPVDSRVRLMLESRGLPEALIDLVTLASRVPGAMPGCSKHDRHTLFGPGRIRKVEGVGWDLFGWVGTLDGRLRARTPTDLGPPRAITDVLAQHLQDLRSGALEWHPATGCFVDLRQRTDLAWIDRIPEPQPRHAYTRFANHLDRALTNLRYEVGTFGRFAVITELGYDHHNPRTGRPMRVPDKKQVLFHPGPWLNSALRGDIGTLTVENASIWRTIGIEILQGPVGLPTIGRFEKRRPLFTPWEPLLDRLTHT